MLSNLTDRRNDRRVSDTVPSLSQTSGPKLPSAPGPGYEFNLLYWRGDSDAFTWQQLGACNNDSDWRTSSVQGVLILFDLAVFVNSFLFSGGNQQFVRVGTKTPTYNIQGCDTQFTHLSLCAVYLLHIVTDR